MRGVGVLFDFSEDEQKRRNGARNAGDAGELNAILKNGGANGQKPPPLLGRQSALFVLNACLCASVFTLDLMSG